MSGLGSVYDTMQATDEWGTLAVSKEALIGARFDRIVVPLPDLDGTSGDGWKLDLAKGWRVVNGKRPGDRLVARVAHPGE